MTFLYLAVCQIAIAQLDQFAPKPDSIMVKADQMPYFMGCEAFHPPSREKRECSDLSLVRFLSNHLVYPDKAKHDGTEGTVIVSFVIDQAGLVSGPEVIIDIGGGCGQAALDVVREMPRWEPAVHEGKPVSVRMNLPIQFYLRAEGWDEAEPYSLSWGNIGGKQLSKDQLIENLNNRLYVRGPEGSNRFVDQIEFVFEKEGRTISATSRGEISPELEKVVQRVKKNGHFSIHASVQDNGRFVTVSRRFLVSR